MDNAEKFDVPPHNPNVPAAASEGANPDFVRPRPESAPPGLAQEYSPEECRCALEVLIFAGNTPSIVERRRWFLRWWCAQRPEEAAAWAAGLSERALEVRAVITQGMIQRSPSVALTVGIGLPSAEYRDEICRAAAVAWAATDPAAAAHWIGRRVDLTMRDSLLSLVVSQWATSDMEGVVAFLTQWLSTGHVP